jgi:two-component system phosphate regulon sensor histidine kinase PhoR
MKHAIITGGMFAVAAALALLCAVGSVILFNTGKAEWVWVLILSAVAILALMLWYFAAASILLEKRLMTSLKTAIGTLRGIVGDGYGAAAINPLHAQFTPEITEISNLSLYVSKKFGELAAERDRIAYTLDNMSEGLVVLDSSLNITLINKSAMGFFSADNNIKGQNLLRLTHMPRTLEAAQSAANSNERAVFDIKSSNDDRTLQIFLSPVQDEPVHDEPIHDDGKNARSGAIMLITDVTAVRRAEQIRSDFVANASHELKTPLTSIKGFTELMQSGIIDEPDMVSRYLKLIREETERMIVLIDDILKLSELESVISDTGRAQVSLKLVAQKVSESLALQAQSKDVSIEVCGDTGMLTANPDRMTELILNLVDNAVKYNRAGGRVEVNITGGENTVIMNVTDTGVGIPKESQERVFERFYRVDRGRSRRQGGTGLGLAIVKHIVGLYRGTIELESKPGRGTTIKITLPVK